MEYNVKGSVSFSPQEILKMENIILNKDENKALVFLKIIFERANKIRRFYVNKVIVNLTEEMNWKWQK